MHIIVPIHCVNGASESALPSPAGAGPVKHLVHGSDAIAPHRGHIATCHDGKVHPRMESQFLEVNGKSFVQKRSREAKDLRLKKK